MSDDRFDLVIAIFNAVCDLPASQRGRILAERCNGDAALRREVEALLHSASQGGPMRTAAGAEQFIGAVSAPEPAASVGGGGALPDFGPAFRVVRLLGEGGMGVVYEAEQDRPRRRVAIKVLRPGLATPSMVRRFEHEVETLGRLQHPGIAHIYAAGTLDSRHPEQPHFVMEYIDGLSLTQYAATHDLDTRARVELMIRVCDAVQHAHERGVIHRDLKPANILVTKGSDGARDDGAKRDANLPNASDLSASRLLAAQPKILDFGVARIVHTDGVSAAQHTLPGQLVGTLPYMSPEQVSTRSDDIDTRTDVYALGTITYELLAGRLPLDVADVSTAEAIRQIREGEPLRLASLRRELKGDLDTIVHKAINKDHERRYHSAADLADDLRRYLAGEPIAARRDSAVYVLRKNLRRYRLLAAVTSVFCLLVAAGSVKLAIMYQQQGVLLTQVREQRERAEQESEKARATNTFVREMLGAVDPREARDRDVTVRQVLDDAAQQIDHGSLRDRPELEGEVRLTLGVTYRELGLLDESERHLRLALEARRRELGAGDPAVAEALNELGVALAHGGKYADADESYCEAIRILRARFGGQHTRVADVLTNRAISRELDAKFDAADADGREAVAIFREHHGDARDLALALGIVAAGHKRTGELDRAIELLREAIELQREALPPEHPHFAANLMNLAQTLHSAGRSAEAEPFFREALAIQRKRFGAMHPDLAPSLHNFAGLLLDKGDTAGAAPLLREALAIERRTLGDDHPSVANGLNSLAVMYWQLGDAANAEPLLRDALVICRRVWGEDNPAIAVLRNNLASLLRAKGDCEGALALTREALEWQRERLGEEHPLVAGLMHNVAVNLYDAGEYAEAERLERRALAVQRTVLPRGHPNIAYSLATLGDILVATGQPEEAEPLLRECLAIRTAALPEDHWLIADAKSRLGGWALSQRDYAHAETLLREAADRLMADEKARPDAKRECARRLVQLYEVLDQPEQAEIWRERLMSIRRP